MEFNNGHYINNVYFALLQELRAMKVQWEDRTQEEGLEEIDAALYLSGTAAIIYEMRKLQGRLDLIDMQIDEIRKLQLDASPNAAMVKKVGGYR